MSFTTHITSTTASSATTSLIYAGYPTQTIYIQPHVSVHGGIGWYTEITDEFSFLKAQADIRILKGIRAELRRCKGHLSEEAYRWALCDIDSAVGKAEWAIESFARKRVEQVNAAILSKKDDEQKSA